MQLNLRDVDKLQAELKKRRPLNSAELKRLREEFLIETTYNSNAIEGNTLTLRETALILQQGITIAEKPLRYHLDIIGFKDAFKYMTEIASEKADLTEKIILDFHSLVLMNDAENRGRYRRVPVQILGASYTPPQPYMVQPKINQLLESYYQWQQEKHIIEAIALLHLEFEAIHPFIDGNGRTGRLLLNFELIKHGLLPIDIKFTDRRKYYDCFDNYHSNGNNPEALTELIAAYEIAELKKYLSIITE